MNTLYLKSKLSFLESIKNNELCTGIFKHLCHDLKNTKNTKSFQNDMLLLQNHFNRDIGVISAGSSGFGGSLKRELTTGNDGLKDSIMLCLNNINNKFYKSTESKTKQFFVPDEGPVKISCTDDKGRNRDIWIKVK